MSTSVPTTGVSAAQNVVDELLSFVERTRGISQAQRRRVLDQAAIALYNTTQETPRSRIDDTWEQLHQIFPTASSDAAWRNLFIRLVAMRCFVGIGWGPVNEPTG
ncbi:hypothetical protein IWX50DRAFT_654858 [Phyllosticta citricarpa]